MAKGLEMVKMCSFKENGDSKLNFGSNETLSRCLYTMWLIQYLVLLSRFFFLALKSELLVGSFVFKLFFLDALPIILIDF